MKTPPLQPSSPIIQAVPVAMKAVTPKAKAVETMPVRVDADAASVASFDAHQPESSRPAYPPAALLMETLTQPLTRVHARQPLGISASQIENIG